MLYVWNLLILNVGGLIMTSLSNLGQYLFTFIINILISLVKVICVPLNLLFTTLMPNVSDKVIELTNQINDLFVGVFWGLGALPNTLIVTLLFILSIEVSRFTIYVSTLSIQWVFRLVKNIKFW